MNRLHIANALGLVLLFTVVAWGTYTNERVLRLTREAAAFNHDDEIEQKLILSHAEPRIMADGSGFIIDATPSAVALLGSNVARVIGSSISEWITPHNGTTTITRQDGKSVVVKAVTNHQRINGRDYTITVFGLKS